MNGRRAIAGLCMLCALLVSAIAAQGASASNGITAFTCVKSVNNVPPADFVKEHCKAGDTGTNAYGHVAIAENTTTHITLTNQNNGSDTKTPSIHRFKSTVAGSAIEVTSPNVHCTGGLENKKDPTTSEHYIEAHELTCTYSEVHEELLGCTVTGLPEGEEGGKEMIMTKPLKSTSKGGTAESIVLSPKAGSILAEFELTGCIIAPLKIKVFGSITCKANGATINCNHAEITGKKTMRIQNETTGPVAGYEGEITVTGSHKEEGVGTTKPLSITTVT